MIAVDNSEKIVEFGIAKAKKNGLKNLEFRQGDLQHPPIEPNSVDLAILSQALHHAAEPAAALQSAYKILKPGGQIMILDLLKHNFDEARELYGDRWPGFAESDLHHWLEAAVDAFDVATKPINKTSDKLDDALMFSDKPVFRSFSVARLRYTAARYDAEARLNQAVANVYELQVRKANLSAERHHRRSAKFFFGMLAAQLGVIVATFSIAAQKKNLLWSIAAAAGATAISFAAYVYFCI